MTTTVIDSTDKKPANPQALVEYSREIAPMLKDLLHQKELLKDFKESDDTAIDLADAIKTAQEQLKDYLAKEDDAVEISGKIVELENDIKQAVAGAARVCDYKPAELKKFFLARVKETVAKTVDIGTAFAELERLLS